MCWGGAILVVRTRSVITLMALVGQFVSTFAMPLPVVSSPTKDSSVPYPCQERPCGCASANECWAGDCCCFTLEEKLAWAESKGIEPPAHVRPAVEARKARRAAAKKGCCCSDKKSATKSADNLPKSCCEHRAQCSAECCAASCEDKGPSARPSSDKNNSTYCAESKSAKDHSAIRWVVGIYSDKCRGKGPLGQSAQEPSVRPNAKPVHIPAPQPVAVVICTSQQVSIITISPPTPPPRSS